MRIKKLKSALTLTGEYSTQVECKYCGWSGLFKDLDSNKVYCDDCGREQFLEVV